MKIGMYDLFHVDAGRFRLDGGAMFGVIPKVLWERKSSADDKNRIGMAANLLLLKSEDKKILIDTSIGYKSDEKFNKIYAIDYSEYDFNRSLKNLNMSHEDITDVILTHLHFDHVGGSTRYDENGKAIPTFSNAKYYVQKNQLDWAKNPIEKDRASFLKDNFLPLEESGQLEILEEDGELFPGIELIIVNGHTAAQQLVLIKGDDKHLLFAADLIPRASHIPIPWVMGYDNEPLKTIQEKKDILARAVAENWLIFFEHDPEIRCSTIRKGDKDYELGEVVPFQ